MKYEDCRDRSQFNQGRKDRHDKKGCLSANGSYINGWYYEEEINHILRDGDVNVQE